MQDPELKKKFDLLDYHWKHVLAAGNEEFDLYQRKWWAYVLRHGHIKVGTTLFYFGEEGTGKGLALVSLMSHGVIGKNYAWVCTNLKRFTGNFSAHRFGKIAVIFNECVDMANGGEWDKLKAVIADDEYVHEGKGKAMYMREETAAYIFISNWANAVKLGNGDRRYACIEMS